MLPLAPLTIGTVRIDRPLVLAPMAGVTDKPFRTICRAHGAGYAVSEMLTSDKSLWASRKSALRMDHAGEAWPIGVQIAGADPDEMAEAARGNAGNGAQIIDINMGCPAKKVCNVMAGSALLQDEGLVGQILTSVVTAVDVPVTLKIRTGWDPGNRNAVTVAKIAEQAGIQALAIHGRTRACGYRGEAEYQTIRDVKQAVSVPVIANGDITCPEKARQVLEQTGADAIMIGRAAQGRPWIFREIEHYMSTGKLMPEPGVEEIHTIMIEHLHNLYDFYGEYTGVRVARKHIAWYSKGQRNGAEFRQRINRVESSEAQLAMTHEFFDALRAESELAA
jgi:tRNA-dihydrouridine synthase B